MKTSENGVLENSTLYFYSPSQTAKNLYFYPVSAGHYFCNEKYHLKRDNFESLLIGYVINGKLNIVSRECTLTAEENSTFIINCFEPHEYYAEKECEFLWLHINGSNCKMFYDEITKVQGNIISGGDMNYIKKLISRLIRGVIDGNISEANFSLDIYKLLLNFQTANITINFSENHEENIVTAKNYIFKNLYKKISVEEVAAVVHLSPSHFSRMFKSQTGFSPYDYILNTRLNKAKDYLQKTDLSVSEIAFKLGFSSDTSFITFFKKHTGLSPKKFRGLRF